MKINVIRTKSPYNFKFLKNNAEAVFLNNHNIVNLYVPQKCLKCNYNSIGYYKYIKEPQHFNCVNCGFQWSINKEPHSTKWDEVEASMYEIDRQIYFLMYSDVLNNKR